MLSGNSLLSEVRSRAEREDLFNRNENLARFAVRDWMRRNGAACERWRLEWDDLLSVALAALWEATEKWEPRRAKFSTFAILLIWARLGHVVAGENRVSRGARAERAVSLDALLPGSEAITIADSIAAPDDSPEQAALRLVPHPDLWAAVEELPERQKVALRLCFWDGLTCEQAAARLGVTRQTVAARVTKAASRLRILCRRMDLRD